MDEVAEVVVVIGRAVVGFQAVVGDGIEAVWKDIVRRVEGEQFATSFGDSTEFVVLEFFLLLHCRVVNFMLYS